MKKIKLQACNQHLIAYIFLTGIFIFLLAGCMPTDIGLKREVFVQTDKKENTTSEVILITNKGTIVKQTLKVTAHNFRKSNPDMTKKEALASVKVFTKMNSVRGLNCNTTFESNAFIFTMTIDFRDLDWLKLKQVNESLYDDLKEQNYVDVIEDLTRDGFHKK